MMYEELRLTEFGAFEYQNVTTLAPCFIQVIRPVRSSRGQCDPAQESKRTACIDYINILNNRIKRAKLKQVVTCFQLRLVVPP